MLAVHRSRGGRCEPKSIHIFKGNSLRLEEIAKKRPQFMILVPGLNRREPGRPSRKTIRHAHNSAILRAFKLYVYSIRCLHSGVQCKFHRRTSMPIGTWTRTSTEDQESGKMGVIFSIGLECLFREYSEISPIDQRSAQGKEDDDGGCLV